MAGGSRSVASRTSVPSKASSSAKTPPTPKETPKEPITLSESVESSSEEGTRTAPLDVPPIQIVGAILIRGSVVKWARTSKPAIEGKAAKLGRTSGPAETTPSLPADKGKKAMDHLSSALDNELLNAIEVTAESMLDSAARMMCERMLKGSQTLLIPGS